MAMAPNSRETGLFKKFNVTRTDGSHRPGGKHDGCDYYVLDLSHDVHAMPALEAYIVSLASADTHPILLKELITKYMNNVDEDFGPEEDILVAANRLVGLLTKANNVDPDTLTNLVTAIDDLEFVPHDEA